MCLFAGRCALIFSESTVVFRCRVLCNGQFRRFRLDNRLLSLFSSFLRECRWFLFANSKLIKSIFIRIVQFYGFWAEKRVQKINKIFFGHTYHNVFFRFFIDVPEHEKNCEHTLSIAKLFW